MAIVTDDQTGAITWREHAEQTVVCITMRDVHHALFSNPDYLHGLVHIHCEHGDQTGMRLDQGCATVCHPAVLLSWTYNQGCATMSDLQPISGIAVRVVPPCATLPSYNHGLTIRDVPQ
eukprot:1140989-Pelagomonas_calceolata.AAC.6